MRQEEDGEDVIPARLRRGPFTKKDVAAMSHHRRDVGKPIRGPVDPLQEDLKAIRI